MLQIDGISLLWQIVNFVALLVILNFLLFRPLRRKLNERGQAIADTLQNARDQEAAAVELRQQWEQRMRNVEQEAEEIIEQARQQAEARGAELLAEARRRLERLEAEQLADLQHRRDELVAQHYDEFLEALVDIAGSVVRSVTTRRAHDDLVTNLQASIYQLPQAEIEEYRHIMADRVPIASVTTPVALTADQTQTLIDTLSSAIDRRMELQVTVDPALIAGLRVRVADRLFDNSIQQQLARVRERAYRDLVARLGEPAHD